MSLIACIPNISEGRRHDVIDAMARDVGAVSGVTLLDYSADPAHHRSVFTFVGDAEGLERAVLALYARAVAAIDLRIHHGEHPRIGAVDVVPFVPLAGSTMSECVALARQVGQAVAARFQVPVYLYEDAATRPDRRRLEAIRRGGFEGLGAKMAAADWAPDFGPSAPHPTAGASAIGARPPLIAFNVSLASDRLDAAKAIAAAIRQSGGGLRSVKALGIRLADRGIVQVSMNLTNYRDTPIQAAFDRVRREAERHHVSVLDSEIVGLVPADALTAEVASHIGLRGVWTEKILERRLRE